MTITRSEHGLKFKEWLQMFWPCPGFAATMNVSFANTCSFRNKSLHNKVRLIVIVNIGIFIQETTKPTNFETYCIQISVAAAKKSNHQPLEPANNIFLFLVPHIEKCFFFSLCHGPFTACLAQRFLWSKGMYFPNFKIPNIFSCDQNLKPLWGFKKSL